MSNSKKLLQIYEKTNEQQQHDGLLWYPRAHEIAINLSDTYGVDVDKVIGIIAALSPLKQWEHNIDLAEDFLKNGQCGHTSVFNQKCCDIIEGFEIESVLNGDKIVNFYKSIRNPFDPEPVCIDRHAMKPWKTYDRLNKTRYRRIARAYQLAAKHIGIVPSALQAVLWIYLRDKNI